MSEGFRVISGGTDTHVMLIDVFSKGISGNEAEFALHEAGITVNKNSIPFDVNPPMKPSGIRIGSPALTTRGMREEEMRTVGKWIVTALEQRKTRKHCTDPWASPRTDRALPTVWLAANSRSCFRPLK